MKKLWLSLPIILAIVLLLSTPHTQRRHPPEISTSLTQSHTNPLQRRSIVAPDINEPPSRPEQRKKSTAVSSSTQTGTANTADKQGYTYRGDALYPYLSWDEKMKMYFHGRDIGAVRYPLGLDFQGVQQLSDNVYSINQQEFNQQAKQQDLMSQAKIDDSHGSPTFSEVVPGGVFDRLGIISGDQITSLDGSTIHNYSDLYTAYQQTQGKRQITVNILRNGHPAELTYFIQ